MAGANSEGHIVRGRRGEEVARDLLERVGYRIVDINVRFGRKQGLGGELDIVAWDGPALCFVEVKTRRGWGRQPVSPAESVTPAKQRQIARLALAYVVRFGLSDDIALRFDVVAVTLEPDGETVHNTRLIRGAFLAPDDLI